MGTGGFNAGGFRSPEIDKHWGVEINYTWSLCYRNSELQSDGPLDSLGDFTFGYKQNVTEPGITYE